MGIRWSQFVANALWLYTQRQNITYCLGCSGEVAGRDKHVEDCFKYYYSSTKEGETKWHDKIGASIPGWNPSDSADVAWQKWLSVYGGKLCFDCSGYLDWCLGYKGIHKYSSWDFGSMASSPSLKVGPAGSAIWKTGHVGIDIGYGYECEIGYYGGTIELHQIVTTDFVSSHKINDVDYTGAI